MKKISTIWLGGCSGCHMSLLDIDEKLIELTSEAKIVKSTPIVDIKNFPQADIGIVEGAVATKEDEENLKKIRECCKILVAIGDCACFGGITSYRNLFEKEEVLQRVFIESESVEKGKIPQSKFVPPILEKVKPINAVVTVDCYIPGCPPNAKVIFYALKELLTGRIPVLPSEMVSFE
ncbi:MAG: NADP oxidoreductase [Candidatus Bathyarchaeia archaeon]|nr:NADP oxidoreductase [Candidatus Bathyarchaeota archaeon]